MYEYNILRAQGPDLFSNNEEISWGADLPTDVTLIDPDPADDLPLNLAPGSIWRYNTVYNAASDSTALVMGGTMAGNDRFDKNLISFHGTNPFAGTYTSCLAGNTCVNRKTTSAPTFKDPTAGDFRPIAGSAADGFGALLVSNLGCTESWDCSPWSNYCDPDNLQLRSCQDLNHCRTEDQKPALTQSCSATGETQAPTAPSGLGDLSPGSVSGGCGVMSPKGQGPCSILLFTLTGLALVRRRRGK